jgi:hypothetical protein
VGVSWSGNPCGASMKKLSTRSTVHLACLHRSAHDCAALRTLQQRLLKALRTKL